MTSTTVREEKQGEILGVAGRFHNVIRWPWEGGLIANQTWTSERREYTRPHGKERLQVEIRFDDSCKNGHQTFAITATGWELRGPRWVESFGGCCHEEIARRFPELQPLIKWHLVSTDGPMHYLANTTYQAGNRDYNGRLAGEPCQWKEGVVFDKVPIVHELSSKLSKFLQEHSPLVRAQAFDFEVIRMDHGDRGQQGKYQYNPKFTFGGFAKAWHECPFDTEEEAMNFLYALSMCNPQFVKVPTAYSEGKARELDHARSSAVWPEATDEELSVSKDELIVKLKARLPALMADFEDAMTKNCGFIYEASTKGAATP